MLRLKKVAICGLFIIGSIGMFNPQFSVAQNGEGEWVCCQAQSDGCHVIMGNHYESDYRSYSKTCTICNCDGIEVIVE